MCSIARQTEAFSTTSLSFRQHRTKPLLFDTADATLDAEIIPRGPNVMRIYTGDDGKSHLESLHLSMTPFMDTEGAKGWATPFEDGNSDQGGISFRTSAPGYALDWHCAPRRQYVIQLQGQLEVECSDGCRFVAGPGDVLLAEDLTGDGHKTRVVGDDVRVYAVVPLLDE
eukprot:CAMPEP_0170912508 /NCGR_PEP_ID=MMETSP0735-20130129/4388_1 /TAXON_ID=186038 /ORGANISM="Fragilariopsis kerguelensis, Strain L26-C5" /LENGTH=169 /DNA_ID=CAMNT_0011309727 /DNA_START=26 /DNA_END=535 /DNA_ORIENTATION=-